MIEDSINCVIGRELDYSHNYLCVSMHFDRPDVNLPYIARWFRKLSDEKRERACKLMQFQNLHGARIKLTTTRSIHRFIPKIGEQGVMGIFKFVLKQEKFEDIIFEVLRVSCQGNPLILQLIDSEFSSTKQQELIDEITKIIANMKESRQCCDAHTFDKYDFVLRMRQ